MFFRGIAPRLRRFLQARLLCMGLRLFWQSFFLEGKVLALKGTLWLWRVLWLEFGCSRDSTISALRKARTPSAVVSTLFTLNFNFNTSATTYPLYWNLMLVSLPFAAYKYMRLNRYLVLTTLVSGAIFLLWVYVGYPQFFPDRRASAPLPGSSRRCRSCPWRRGLRAEHARR